MKVYFALEQHYYVHTGINGELKKKKEKKLRCEHIKFNECLVAAILTIESDHNEWSVLERALVPYDETEGCSKLMHRHNTHKIALLSPSLM